MIIRTSKDILSIFLNHLPAPSAHLNTILHMGIDILFAIESSGQSIFVDDEIDLLRRAFGNNIFDVIDEYINQIDNSMINNNNACVFVFDLLVEAARLIIDTRQGKNYANGTKR